MSHITGVPVRSLGAPATIPQIPVLSPLVATPISIDIFPFVLPTEQAIE